MSTRIRISLPPSDLKRVGAAEMIAASLHQQILAGDLRPGDALREVEVATAFGVARNTAREGLKLLVRTGLATHEVHHGVAVRRLTAVDVNQLYGLRLILEEAACGRAGSLADAERTSLRDSLEEGQRALEQADVWRATVANQRFHRAIVGLLHNPRTEAVTESLLAELSLGLMLEERDEEAGRMWLGRNQGLYDLLSSGPPESCRRALAAYLDLSRRSLLRYL